MRIAQIAATRDFRDLIEREGKFPKGRGLAALPTAKVCLDSDVEDWMREQIGSEAEALRSAHAHG